MRQVILDVGKGVQQDKLPTSGLSIKLFRKCKIFF